MSIQNIMNVCFAICITLLIYQNTQLKDDISQNSNFIRLLDAKSTRDFQQIQVSIQDSIIDEYYIEDIVERCNIRQFGLGDTYSISC